MKLQVLVIGKTKEKWCQEGEEYYLERVRQYVPLEYRVLSAEKITENMPSEEIMRREGKKLLESIDPKSKIIALSPEGKSLSSPELAELFQKYQVHGEHAVTFVIGGALGLSPEVKESADLIISFSKLTFPHDLFRIFLLEQIYRAYTILQGKNYHK
jgi:23S rRNA (pseudouridine1915-N3)-methyltransferase